MSKSDHTFRIFFANRAPDRQRWPWAIYDGKRVHRAKTITILTNAIWSESGPPDLVAPKLGVPHFIFATRGKLKWSKSKEKAYIVK